MRLRNTKERMRDRREFCYMYREEIIFFMELQRKNPYGSWKDTSLLQFIDQVARRMLQYNPATYSFDIWMSIQRTFRELLNLFPHLKIQ